MKRAAWVVALACIMLPFSARAQDNPASSSSGAAVRVVVKACTWWGVEAGEEEESDFVLSCPRFQPPASICTLSEDRARIVFDILKRIYPVWPSGYPGHPGHMFSVAIDGDGKTGRVFELPMMPEPGEWVGIREGGVWKRVSRPDWLKLREIARERYCRE